MPKRNRLVVPLLVVLIASVASAATGTMEFRVTSSLTHNPVQATIQGDGQRAFSLTTNTKGYGKMIGLPVGEYRLEISAPGYGSIRTRFLVEAGKTTKAGALLTPQTLPEEESPEVLDPLLRPGYTLLHEYVADADTGEPLSGVKVRFVNAGVETETDSKGHFVLSVPTPEPEYPGGAGTDTLIYEKPGYKTIILRNFAIASDDMGGGAVDMHKGKGVSDEDATHKMLRKESGDYGPPQARISGGELSSDLYSWLGTTGSAFAIGAAATPGTLTPQPIVVPRTIKVDLPPFSAHGIIRRS